MPFRKHLILHMSPFNYVQASQVSGVFAVFNDYLRMVVGVIVVFNLLLVFGVIANYFERRCQLTWISLSEELFFPSIFTFFRYFS